MVIVKKSELNIPQSGRAVSRTLCQYFCKAAFSLFAKEKNLFLYSDQNFLKFPVLKYLYSLNAFIRSDPALIIFVENRLSTQILKDK